MCYADNIKWDGETTEGIEKTNLKKKTIRKLEEKDNYRYLGILEADTNKDEKKITSEGPENFSKPLFVEISSMK